MAKFNKNNKTLLIHVGPPKTGTTSLQYYFKKNISNNTFYLGIVQPRFKTDNHNADMFFKYLRRQINKDQFVSVINDIPQKFILYSEEGILHQNVWVENLKRLQELREYFNIKISYCYRDAVSVIPSYYAECHSYLSPVFKNSFLEFLNSQYSSQYRIFDFLKMIDKPETELQIFNFNDLINGQLSLNQIFNLSENNLAFTKKIKLEKKNAKKKISDNYYLVEDHNTRYPYKLKYAMKLIGKLANKDLRFLIKKKYKLHIYIPEQLYRIKRENQNLYTQFKNERSKNY